MQTSYAFFTVKIVLTFILLGKFLETVEIFVYVARLISTCAGYFIYLFNSHKMFCNWVPKIICVAKEYLCVG